MAYDRTFAALADPTRRQVLERLRERPRSVGELAGLLPISQPAVSQHLKLLREAGLVVQRAEGSRRIYSIRPEGLKELRGWLDSMWDDVLSAFASGGGHPRRRRR
jgi:DNA-binding transcriptional ArsR family regulator